MVTLYGAPELDSGPHKRYLTLSSYENLHVQKLLKHPRCKIGDFSFDAKTLDPLDSLDRGYSLYVYCAMRKHVKHRLSKVYRAS